MTETQAVTTRHGEVEYEVVECDSCGNSVLPSETSEFTIGDRDGVACQMCVDEGPIGFPSKTRETWFGPIYGLGESPVFGSPLRSFFFSSMFIPISFILHPVEDNRDTHDYHTGYAHAIWHIVLWIAIGVAIVKVFAA
jgi:hypothetical protein